MQTVKDLKRLKVVELRDECAKVGLDIKGTKGVLLERLFAHLGLVDETDTVGALEESSNLGCAVDSTTHEDSPDPVEESQDNNGELAADTEPAAADYAEGEEEYAEGDDVEYHDGEEEYAEEEADAAVQEGNAEAFADDGAGEGEEEEQAYAEGEAEAEYEDEAEEAAAVETEFYQGEEHLDIGEQEATDWADEPLDAEPDSQADSSRPEPGTESVSSKDAKSKDDKTDVPKVEDDRSKSPAKRVIKKKEEEKALKRTQDNDNRKAELEPEEGQAYTLTAAPNSVHLNLHSCDLHCVLSSDGLSAHNLVKNDMNLMWCGVKANAGVSKGRVCYECKVVKKLDVNLPESEEPKFAARIGWSAEKASLQLGESFLSFGFESTGKMYVSGKNTKTDHSFHEGDIICAYLDMDSSPMTYRYTRNGVDLGITGTLVTDFDGHVMYPHVFFKNFQVQFNFYTVGPFSNILDGYSLIGHVPEDLRVMSTKSATSKDQCEVLVMCGVTSSGKSYWAYKYAKEHRDKMYYTVSSHLIWDRFKLDGHSRKRKTAGYEKLITASHRIFAKMLELASTRPRNYIIDQNNLFPATRTSRAALFEGFRRRAICIIPRNSELHKRISEKRSKEGLDISYEEILDMKLYITLPTKEEGFDDILYVDCDEKTAKGIIEDYNYDVKKARERRQSPPAKRTRIDGPPPLRSREVPPQRFFRGRGIARGGFRGNINVGRSYQREVSPPQFRPRADPPPARAYPGRPFMQRGTSYVRPTGYSRGGRGSVSEYPRSFERPSGGNFRDYPPAEASSRFSGGSGSGSYSPQYSRSSAYAQERPGSSYRHQGSSPGNSYRESNASPPSWSRSSGHSTSPSYRSSRGGSWQSPYKGGFFSGGGGSVHGGSGYGGSSSGYGGGSSSGYRSYSGGSSYGGGSGYGY